MKISLNWISDYVQTGLEPDEIAEILSDLGFPLEGIKRSPQDTVLDVEVTSNRGDCLGHIGIARELAAATGKELKIPNVELKYSDTPVEQLADVEIAQPELCGRYTAAVVEGVKVGPTPDWMAERLEALGLRTVNNVVDATNYAMLETGQPPHAFDYHKIEEAKIIVRKAVAGEKLISIDGTDCRLTPEMLIIADSRKPVAVAGVMGGLHTEVGRNTKKILLEDACFDPVTVRTAARKLALHSEAAFRFERIVDICAIDWASKRTTQLIIQVAGGYVAKGLIDVYPAKPTTRNVTLRLERLKKLLGVEVPQDQVLEILSQLNFQPKRKGGRINCLVPSWRNDIHREIDLIEEIARVFGYDKIPTQKKIQIEVAPVDPRQKLVQNISDFLSGCGFYETISVSFVDDSTAELLSPEHKQQYLSVTDVSRKHANLLRTTLVGSLLQVLKINRNAKNSPCQIFEVANTFVPHKNQPAGLPLEKTKLALLTDTDFRRLKGVIEGLISNLNRDAHPVFEPVELPWAEVAAQILLHDEMLGLVGLTAKKIADKFDFKELTPCVAELDLQALHSIQNLEVKAKPVPRFPAVERDLSIIVKEPLTWAKIADIVNQKAPPELEDLRFVGIYRGRGIPDDSKSVTFSMRFRDEQGTLTRQNVDAFQKDIVKGLETAVGAKLRTA